MKQTKRGGFREGAGRKPLAVPSTPVKVFLQPDLLNKFRELGGQRWLRRMLTEHE